MKEKIRSAFLGLAIGDALGVPVEFMSRATIAENPVREMRGFGTHQQPAGTWSDDSSLAFCLAEALCAKGTAYSPLEVAANFVRWYAQAYWSAGGEVFDIGISTAQAIRRLESNPNNFVAGNWDENSNGNGSLMRILPLAFAIQQLPISERFERIADISSITHAHIRSILGCFIYTEYALLLLQGQEKHQAYAQMQAQVNAFLQKSQVCSLEEIHRYHRILENPYGDYLIRPLLDYSETEISSSGYVVATLEASLWCFLKYDTFESAVLAAVNLGSDTDTTGCVTGGLAGLYHGEKSIPKAWLQTLAKRTEIEDLAERLADKLS